ncbi:LURP-one-related/scramblase family protein [Riemerella columbipharyngis]|uniref:LURP-one-related n=1 Tax=Riemerella columbipharyngis TaxID=1071918 RepID=A0A1G7AV79_9FLAO|nr:hypothetical protein [Riemerella columbipharyngis]SDE18703.1 hypothetical protein SAMN05421544_104109 [Riemerella columbipharyngis]
MIFEKLNFPLNFTFKISTLANDFTIEDSLGNSIGYVRQKMFKLKEDVIIYDSDKKNKELVRIKADRWLDFNASYSISDAKMENKYGRLARKGMKSIWKAHYDIIDDSEQLKFHITENNPFVRILDGLVGEIPIVGYFTGYIFNPTYSVKDKSGKEYFKLKKMPSFFGRKFRLEKISDIDSRNETLVVLSLFMMMLLERMRG